MRSFRAGLFIILLAACSADSVPLVATDVVIAKPRPGMQMTAGYLTLANNSTQAITITRVMSSEFRAVKMHESVIENGVARMYPLPEVTLPAGETVMFEPGGKHLMLLRPTGDNDTVNLDFYAGESVVLTVNVALTD